MTSVYTSYEVITSTDVGNSVFVTSLPKSLYTRTTVVAADTTLVPVLAPAVVYTSSEYVINTIINAGSTSLQTASTRVVTTSRAATATGTSDGDDNDNDNSASATATRSAAVSTLSQAGGAKQTMIPAAVGALAMGFAAMI